MALSATDWYSLLDRVSDCLSKLVGRGAALVSLVGNASSALEVGVEALRVGVAVCAMLGLFLYGPLGPLAFSSLGVFEAGLFVAGVTGCGEIARLLTADSLLALAGNTRFCGVTSAMIAAAPSLASRS